MNKPLKRDGKIAPLLLTIPEAAIALAVGQTTVKGLIAAGDIPSLKIGKRRLVRRTALETFISRREAGIYRQSSRG